jgi:DnaJ-class molecular chaperone
MADPYTTLGVAKTASQDDIRKAYRKLAKETHPDLNPGNTEAEKRFKQVAAAYDILGDETKRKRFDAGEIDETGAEKPERHFYREYAEADPGMRYNRPRGGGERSGPAGAGGRASSGFEGLDDDILAELFRHRGGAGREGSSSQSFRAHGSDLHYVMSMPFVEAAKGGRRHVAMPDGKTLDLEIPPGIRDGQILRLKGQGGPGIGGGPAGDAYVELQVLPHPQFRRDGYDVLTELPVSLGEALNGASVRAETIDGPVDVKIPKRSKTGTTLRLKGKGIAKGKAGDRGDQKIELRVVPPSDGDDELAAFMAAWEAKHPQNPRKFTGGRS